MKWAMFLSSHFTASATPEVQDDICNKLNFSGRNIFRTSFARPNLSYSAFSMWTARSRSSGDTRESARQQHRCIAAACKRASEISDQLNLYGIQSECYHAGLPCDERSRRQEAWIRNEIRTIVCTNAFGMGIDKPDVRIVVLLIHLTAWRTTTRKQAVQAAMAKRSYAVLLYDHQDPEELRALPEIRFPGIEDIRKIYTAVMNYIQVPTGLGGGSYYDFELNDLTCEIPSRATPGHLRT